jgi:hypothetical protein
MHSGDSQWVHPLIDTFKALFQKCKVRSRQPAPSAASRPPAVSLRGGGTCMRAAFCRQPSALSALHCDCTWKSVAPVCI